MTKHDWLDSAIAKGVRDHAFAALPAGILVEKELVEELWRAHLAVGHKLTLDESMEIVRRLSKTKKRQTAKKSAD